LLENNEIRYTTLLLLLLTLLTGCTKPSVKDPGMDLRYASVYINAQEIIPGLKRLPDWPTDSIESRVLQDASKQLFLKFQSEFSRRMRDCRYRTVDHPDMADAVISLNFPSITMKGDTLVFRSDLNVSDRRSGRKESFNFETRVLKGPSDKSDVNRSSFHMYGQLFNQAVKKLNAKRMVDRICP
jgi:hypothetical protein